MAGQLIRRGDDTWCVRVYTGRDANGKRSYINKTVHGTKKEADQELRKLLAQRHWSSPCKAEAVGRRIPQRLA